MGVKWVHFLSLYNSKQLQCMEHVWSGLKWEIRKLMSCLITKSDAFRQTWSSSRTKRMCLITVTTFSSCLITAMMAGKHNKPVEKNWPIFMFSSCRWRKGRDCVMFLFETSKMADEKTSAWHINAERRSEAHWQRMSSSLEGLRKANRFDS